MPTHAIIIMITIVELFLLYLLLLCKNTYTVNYMLNLLICGFKSHDFDDNLAISDPRTAKFGNYLW